MGGWLQSFVLRFLGVARLLSSPELLKAGHAAATKEGHVRRHPAVCRAVPLARDSEECDQSSFS